MSYEYLKGKGLKQLKAHPDMHLFIDSGAYTYINDIKYHDISVEEWEDHIVKYLDWGRKHKDSIFAMADLDLQYLVGYEKVKEWREKYFEPFMLETGIPICFIYHEDGEYVWEYMCKRYPYLGISMATDSTGLNDLRGLFKTAEKYNTVVQGMGSTNTKHLTGLPFYTVDSTTWNIGLKYGEMSIWRGTNMGRVKKADFETRAFPCVRSYSREFNLDLIREEDNTTMIQVNAWAFIEAEKYIQDRLKASMYWLKTRASNNDLDNLPDDFFPSPELLRLNDQNTLKEYASKMNINPDSDVTSARVLDMTTFLNWDDPDYEEFHEVYIGEDKLINQYHDFFINRIVQSEEEKLEDLIKFYKECLSGKNDRLLQEGTNFDRIVRDRDEYIEEEEYEEIDVGIEEINRLIPDIQLRLTTEESAPDIEELDKEIFSKTNVQVHRDEKGRILKGTSIRKLNKKMYSDKYPKYACDTCIMAQKCPEYQAGFVCAYNNMFKRFDSRNMSDLIEGMQGMVEFNLMRMQRAMMAEVMSGGVPDPMVTQFINQNMALMNQLKSMYENAGSEVLRQTKVVRSDGSQETNTIVQNPQSGGILEQLFSNVRNKKKYDEDVVEAELIEEVDNG